MKKTKLFILLIIATMLLFVSCKEKPVENIKTTKDYLANKIIFTALNLENRPDSNLQMRYPKWGVALLFDENSNVVNIENWAIKDFVGKVNENKYEISFKAFEFYDDEISPYSFAYNLTIEAINSSRVKISGTVSHASAFIIDLSGEANLSDRAPEWIHNYSWNLMEGFIYEGDNLPFENGFGPIVNSQLGLEDVNFDAKATNETYTVNIKVKTDNSFTNGTIFSFKRSAANSYELNTFSSETMIQYLSDGRIIEETREENFVVARFDELPDWAKEYDLLMNEDGSLYLTLSEEGIYSSRANNAVINNGDGTFRYIEYLNLIESDDEGTSVCNRYKLYFDVKNTDDGIKADYWKVFVDKNGNETIIEEKTTINLYEGELV